MRRQLALGLAVLATLLAGACSNSSVKHLDGSVEGKGGTGGKSAGSGGTSRDDSGTASGSSGKTGGAGTDGGSASMHVGGSAGTGAGGGAGKGAAGSAPAADGGVAVDAGKMAGETCDSAVSSVSMCGANVCLPVSSSAQACTVNCCTAHGECGTRTATLDGASACHAQPTCDSAVSSVSMCGANACPAVSASADACTVNCCDNMMRCGVRTAVLGDPVGRCQVPPTCDSTVQSVTMCGTNTCAAVSSTAPACTVNCCDNKMRCGTLTAIMGSKGECRTADNGG
jgi:hypothetical protein